MRRRGIAAARMTFSTRMIGMSSRALLRRVGRNSLPARAPNEENAAPNRLALL